MNTLDLFVRTCLCLQFSALPALGPDGARPNQPSKSAPAADEPARPRPANAGTIDTDTLLLDVAAKYSDYRLASPWPEWALAMCRVVTAKEITGVPSRSEDERTHGTKLYKLWVSDYDSYMRMSGVEPSRSASPSATPPAPPLAAAPVGLTLVKETFATVEVSKSEEPKPNPHRRDLIVDGEKAYRQGAPGELFIMTKLDPKTPDTDIGWVYAVVSADHKKVLQSGRIENCMHCHERTTRDRLYGLESTWPKDAAGKPTPPVIKREVKAERPDATKDKPIEPRQPHEP